jgi:hypothetical protein
MCNDLAPLPSPPTAKTESATSNQPAHADSRRKVTLGIADVQSLLDAAVTAALWLVSRPSKF